MDWLYKIKSDKLLHFIAGLLITQVVSIALLALTGRLAMSVLLGGTAGLIVALAKELYDKLGHGVPSWHDFFATAIGSLVGMALISLALWTHCMKY